MHREHHAHTIATLLITADAVSRLSLSIFLSGICHSYATRIPCARIPLWVVLPTGHLLLATVFTGVYRAEYHAHLTTKTILFTGALQVWLTMRLWCAPTPTHPPTHPHPAPPCLPCSHPHSSQTLPCPPHHHQVGRLGSKSQLAWICQPWHRRVNWRGERYPEPGTVTLQALWPDTLAPRRGVVYRVHERGDGRA